MKILIETDGELSENEIIIRCNSLDDEIMFLHKELVNLLDSDESSGYAKISFSKGNQEFFFPIDSVIFFETDGNQVFAHTTDDSYQINYRLYELENMLQSQFIRVAKSSIVNINHIFSVSKNIASASLVKLNNTHKQLYVSRYYYKSLKQRLMER